MDAGYQPGYSFSQQNSYASGSNNLPHFFPEHTAPSTSMESSELPSGPEAVPRFPFDPPLSGSHGFSSSALIDYAIFNTPVDISLGALPPRPTTSRALAQGRIPRPRNAFMLFRSAFHRERHLAKSVEKDHRHISRIIGLCWAELPEAEKDVWRQKAELEKQQHALAYPDYRFKPTPRTKQPVKRNVKRNSPKELERCQKIAKLIQDGKSGEELTHAVRRMEGEVPHVLPGEGTAMGGREERRLKKQRISNHTHSSTSHCSLGPDRAHQLQPGFYVAADEPPPFRSPLLPPSDLPQVHSKRPYSAAVVELVPPTQPMVESNPPEPPNELYMAQTYGAQGFMTREPDRKSRQRLQGQQQLTFEWPTKDFPVTPYDVALRDQYSIPVSSHYPHYASFNQRGPVFDTPYTSGGEFAPGHGAMDWSTYTREDAAVAASGVYESWSNSASNTSVSPVHSDSPITPV
ncbi:hypothetical protein P691DRAFT_799954 [Macrolepiota fuliginosa MF-IS2]|uniref:HMG box domain-containing protein n=1 Tax=Macrolepiota fuliginosa MF-IS2 TaxID=1400762 RepID=A0A9P5XQZ8_9AGAR|nr:hypothetical protein P691DRAFT_799954 [Macrolepiota fuliginosa MF-IS2]